MALEYGAGIFKSLLSGLQRKPKSDKPIYSAWALDIQLRVDSLLHVLAAVIGVNGAPRVHEQPGQLKKISTSLQEIDTCLVIEDFEGGAHTKKDSKECRVVVAALLDLWYKLLLLLDKVKEEESAAFLSTIWRVALRHEFDLNHLTVLNAGGPDGLQLKCTQEDISRYKRYLTLLSNTYTHIAVRLAEANPIGANSPVIRYQSFYTACAKIMSLCYFRLPDVGKLLYSAAQLDDTMREALWDFTVPIKTADNANYTGYDNNAPGKGLVRTGKGKLPAKPTGAAPTPGESNNNNNADNANGVASLTSDMAWASVAEDVPVPERTGVQAPFPRRAQSLPAPVQDAAQFQAAISDAALFLDANDNGSTTPPLGAAEAADQAPVPVPVPLPIQPNVAPSSITHAQNDVAPNGMAAINSSSSSNGTTPSTPTKSSGFFERLKQSSQPSSPAARLSGRFLGAPALPAATLTPVALTPSLCPTLFNWPKLHLSLLKQDKSARSPGSGAWNEPPRRRWLTWFTRGESALFVLFVKELVAHVQLMLSRAKEGRVPQDIEEINAFKWPLLEGFPQLTEALLYNLRQYERPFKFLLDATKLLLSCDDVLINFYVKTVYTRTKIYNMEQVNAALSKLDAWFSEFDSKLKRKLPVEFDVAYFCSGLEMLLLLDHHQLSARVVSFLYNYAHIFAGDNRIVVICDFLLNKFFYKLFLNWDDVVRNYFQQFIIFKMVRIPRIQLAEAGFNTEVPTRHNPLSSVEAVDSGSEEYAIDVKIFTNVQAYVRTVEDQLRHPGTIEFFDKRLEVYAPKALAEYRFFLSRYQDGETPKLVPLYMIQEKKVPAVMLGKALVKPPPSSSARPNDDI